MTADEVKRRLGMTEHPREGGWFVQTYASGALLPAVTLNRTAEPVDYGGPRRLSTAIYYLLERGTFSEMHRLKSDEVLHHYGGAPLEMLLLHGNGRAERVVLGKDLTAGQRPQVVVPRGVWQGAHLLAETGSTAAGSTAAGSTAAGAAETESWSLVGCTVSPGFEYADYETGQRNELLSGWPEAEPMIMTLTRPDLC